MQLEPNIKCSIIWMLMYKWKMNSGIIKSLCLGASPEFHLEVVCLMNVTWLPAYMTLLFGDPSFVNFVHMHVLYLWFYKGGHIKNIAWTKALSKKCECSVVKSLKYWKNMMNQHVVLLQSQPHRLRHIYWNVYRAEVMLVRIFFYC